MPLEWYTAVTDASSGASGGAGGGRPQLEEAEEINFTADDTELFLGGGVDKPQGNGTLFITTKSAPLNRPAARAQCDRRHACPLCLLCHGARAAGSVLSDSLSFMCPLLIPPSFARLCALLLLRVTDM